MASEKLKVPVGVWTRFKTYDLEIAPSLAGAAHSFTFSGFNVRIVLPGRPKVSDWMAENARMTCWGHRIVNGRKVPLSYRVHDVDVWLDTGKCRMVKPGWLGHVRLDLFTNRERESFDRFSASYRVAMESSFDRWTEVLRWKLGMPSINQLTARQQKSSWGNYLTNSDTKERFFAEPHVMHAWLQQALSKRAWAKVQRALDDGQPVPVWHLYLASAHQKSHLGHEREAIIDLAISAETLVRALVRGFLRKPRNKEFEKMVGRIGITGILRDWRKLGFNTKAWKAVESDTNRVRRVFDLRNQIMHRGVSVADPKVDLLIQSTRSFVAQGERELSRTA